MPDQTSRDATLAPGGFDGRPGEFLGLLVRGALLMIPTFGFYRFWLVTDIRRHLWRNTRIGDEYFDYVGTAREILIGFLIALAITTPLNLLAFGASLGLEFVTPFLSSIGFLGLMAFGQYALYRARRYRASRTVFRGLRFWMDGSGWSYMLRSVLWSIPTALTLGLAYPWQVAALERYLMRHTLFGTLRGDFAATGGQLFRRGWLLWLLLVLCLLVPPLFTIPAIVGQWQMIPEAEREIAIVKAMLATVVAVTIGVAIVWPLFSAIYARWWLDGVRMGDASLVHALRKRVFVLAYLKCAVALLVWGAILYGAGALILTVVGARQLLAGYLAWSQAQTIAIGAGAALFALVAMLGGSVLTRHFITRGLWAAIAVAVAARNIEAFDAAVAAGDPVSGFGEGLADALDVGGV